jgi:hypothetical protein
MFSSRSSSFPLTAPSLRSNSLIFALDSANSVPSVLNSPSFFPISSAPVDSIVAIEAPLTSLESALTQNPPVTPLECALPKNKDLKFFRMNTYKKTGARGPVRPYIIVNQDLANSLDLKLQTGVALVGKKSGAFQRRLRFRILNRSSLGGGGALKLDGNLLFASRFALRDFS